MRNIILFFLVLNLVVFAACSTKNMNDDGIFTIDLSKKYAHREVNLQSIADQECINAH